LIVGAEENTWTIDRRGDERIARIGDKELGNLHFQKMLLKLKRQRACSRQNM
jgi:hypothetical protein